jgi:hypothetical protein
MNERHVWADVLNWMIVIVDLTLRILVAMTITAALPELVIPKGVVAIGLFVLLTVAKHV